MKHLDAVHVGLPAVDAGRPALDLVLNKPSPARPAILRVMNP